MGGRLSGLGTALYDSKRKEFLGRDGGRWGKLGVFYFFFYLGLAGFFCAMLAIFMAFTPRDRPRYTMHSSRMETRSNPLSPGLGFRPQPEVDKNLIVVDKDVSKNETNRYATSLDQYLQVYYGNQDHVSGEASDDTFDTTDEDKQLLANQKFSITNQGECTNTTRYGFNLGRPCVLVKMNKILGFTPEQLTAAQEREAFEGQCRQKPGAVAVHCSGEYPADVDNIGPIIYISENGIDRTCGSLNINRFPYEGKYDRKDRYQAPYIWAQFTNPKPNVLINVICRIYGQNIDFDKKTGRGITRFQIYVKTKPRQQSSRKTGEV